MVDADGHLDHFPDIQIAPGPLPLEGTISFALKGRRSA